MLTESTIKGEPSSSVPINNVAGADEGLGGGSRSETGPLLFSRFLARWTKELNRLGAPSPSRNIEDSNKGAGGAAIPVTLDGEVVDVNNVLE